MSVKTAERREGEKSLFHGGAEFQDASAIGLDRNCEGKSCGFVKKKDDAVEFALAGAAGKRETNGMEEVAAADLELFFQGID